MFAVACLRLVIQLVRGLVFSFLGVGAPVMSARAGIVVLKVRILCASSHSYQLCIKMLIRSTGTAISIIG